VLVDPLAISNPAERAKALQSTFTVAFGFGGLATLALFMRRQWHQEQIHEHDRRVAASTRFDVEQRRITEQYIKAVEQLGHEKAAVRLGGLYALDRLGRNHPEQRTTIVEVWSAYLRRRYVPPSDLRTISTSTSFNNEIAETSVSDAQLDGAAAEEYEVRQTAQRLITVHLKDPRKNNEHEHDRPLESETFWHLAHLDLTGATLVDPDFSFCRIPANFKAIHAWFYGNTSFAGAYFEDEAHFYGARFEGFTSFNWMQANGICMFGSSLFKESAAFGQANFRGGCYLDGVRFLDDASFMRVQFPMGASFVKAIFKKDASFNSVNVKGGMDFRAASFGYNHEEMIADEPRGFEHGLSMSHATLSGEIDFSDAEFHGPVWFREINTRPKASPEEVPLPVEAKFAFGGAVAFAVETEAFDGIKTVAVEDYTWPPSWRPLSQAGRWQLESTSDSEMT